MQAPPTSTFGDEDEESMYESPYAGGHWEWCLKEQKLVFVRWVVKSYLNLFHPWPHNKQLLKNRAFKITLKIKFKNHRYQKRT